MPAEHQRRAVAVPASADRGFKLGSRRNLPSEKLLASKEHLEKHLEEHLEKLLKKHLEKPADFEKIQKVLQSANWNWS